MSGVFFEWAKVPKNKKYVVLIFFLILLLVGVTFFPFGEGKKMPAETVMSETKDGNERDYEATLEKRLENVLSEMEGVGKVSVMITTSTSEEKELAQEVNISRQQSNEQDSKEIIKSTSNDSTSRKVVLDGNKMPYVTKEYAPEIRGVLVVAEGAGDGQIKSQIVQAVSKVLEVEIHKISVEKKGK